MDFKSYYVDWLHTPASGLSRSSANSYSSTYPKRVNNLLMDNGIFNSIFTFNSETDINTFIQLPNCDSDSKSFLRKYINFLKTEGFEESLYHNSQVIYFSDRCLAPMMYLPTSDGKFVIQALSTILGMGMGEFYNKIFIGEISRFDNVIALNSMDDNAYVCVEHDGKWALIRLEENGTIEGAIICDSVFSYNSYSDILKANNIVENNFRISSTIRTTSNSVNSYAFSPAVNNKNAFLNYISTFGALSQKSVNSYLSYLKRVSKLLNYDIFTIDSETAASNELTKLKANGLEKDPCSALNKYIEFLKWKASNTNQPAITHSVQVIQNNGNTNLSDTIKAWNQYNQACVSLSKYLRTNNAVGEFAELLSSIYYDASLLEPSHPSADLIQKDGTLIQVKSRRMNSLKASSLNVIRSWNFDILTVIIFDTNGNLLKAIEIDSETAKSLARENTHQHGAVLVTNNELLENPNAKDITKNLQAIIDNAK